MASIQSSHGSDSFETQQLSQLEFLPSIFNHVCRLPFFSKKSSSSTQGALSDGLVQDILWYLSRFTSWTPVIFLGVSGCVSYAGKKLL